MSLASCSTAVALSDDLECISIRGDVAPPHSGTWLASLPAAARKG
jgi:hypothetical protein